MADHTKTKAQLLAEMERLRERLAEMERLEGERRQSEARLRAALESAPDAIVIADDDGRIVMVNAQAERWFGYRRKELLGKPVEVLVPEDLRKSHGAQRSAYHAQPRTRPMGAGLDLAGRRKDGSAFPVEISLSPIETEQGRFIVGIIRDITRRKKAEEEMRKLSSVVEQTDDSVVITDRHGVIEYVNPAFEKKTGYTREEALGKTPRIVKSGKQGDAYYKALWEILLRGEVFRGMLINRRKNGELYDEEKTITPLKNREGTVTHYVSTGKDVTERRRMEEELGRIRVKKERLEAIRILSMTYAHNVFNAMTPITSYAGMIVRKTDRSDPKRAWAEAILKGTEEVVRIINQLKEIESEKTTELGGMTLLDLDRLKGKRNE